MKKLLKVISLLLVMAMVIPMTSVDIFATETGGDGAVNAVAESSAATVDHASMIDLGQSIYSTGDKDYYAEKGSNQKFELDGAIGANEPYVEVTNGRVVTKTALKATKDYRYHIQGNTSSVSKANDDNIDYSKYSDLKYYVGQDDDYVYLIIEDHAPANISSNIYHVRMGFDPAHYDRVIYTDTGSSPWKRIAGSESPRAYKNIVNDNVLSCSYKLYGYDEDGNEIEITSTSNAAWVGRLEIKLHKDNVKKSYTAVFDDTVVGNIDFNTMYISVNVDSKQTDATTNYVNYGIFFDASKEGLPPEKALPDVIVFGEEKNTAGTCTDGADCDFTGHTVEAKYLVSNLTGAVEGINTYYHTCKNGCGRVSAKTFNTDADGVIYDGDEILDDKDGDGVPDNTVKVLKDTDGDGTPDTLVPTGDCKTGEKSTYYKYCSKCGAIATNAGKDNRNIFEGDAPAHIWAKNEEKVVSPATCTADAVYQSKCSVCDEFSGTEENTWVDEGSKDKHIEYANNTDNPEKTDEKYRYTVAEKKPTCIASGWEEYFECNLCGISEYENKKIAPLRWPEGSTIDTIVDHTDLGRYGQTIYSTGDKAYNSTSKIKLDGKITDTEGWVCITPGDGVTPTVVDKTLGYTESSTNIAKAEVSDTHSAFISGITTKYYVAQDDDYVYLAIDNRAPIVEYTVDDVAYDTSVEIWSYLKLGFNPNDYNQQITLYSNGQCIDFSSKTPVTHEGISYARSGGYVRWPYIVKGFGDDDSFNEKSGDTGIFENPGSDTILELTKADGARVRIYEMKFSKDGILDAYEEAFGKDATAAINFNTMFIGASYSDHASANDADHSSVYWINGSVQNTDETLNSFIPDVIVFGEEKDVGCNFICHDVSDKYLVDADTRTYYHSCVECGASSLRTFSLADGNLNYNKDDIEFGHWYECNICENSDTFDTTVMNGKDAEGEYIVYTEEHVYDQKIIDDQYLVAGCEVNCLQGKLYYKSCLCGAFTTENETFEDVNSRAQDKHLLTENFTYDDSVGHYKECTRTRTYINEAGETVTEKCTAIDDLSYHVFDDSNDIVCDECGYVKSPEVSGGVVGGGTDITPDVTDTTESTDTQAPTTDTEVPDDTGAVDTDVVDTDEDTTIAPETDVQDESSDDTQSDDTSCEGTVTFAGLAIVATLGLCATFVAKKKEDDE